jgi:hypothetical protein
MVKIFRFTTTTTPCRISYVGIRSISTGLQDLVTILIQEWHQAEGFVSDGDDNDDDDDE